MKKKIFIVGAAVVVVGAAYLLIYGGRGSAGVPAPAGTQTPSGSQQSAIQNPAPAPAVSQPTPSAPHVSPPPAPPVQMITVSYSDAGFSPGSVTVTRGGTVVFVNQSSQSFWPASNPHPVHTGYPTTGGCVNSTFDACQPIAPGQSWSFRFDVAGTWGYHDHLHPGTMGTVVVR